MAQNRQKTAPSKDGAAVIVLLFPVGHIAKTNALFFQHLALFRDLPVRIGVQIGEIPICGIGGLNFGHISGVAFVQQGTVHTLPTDNKGILRCLGQQAVHMGKNLRPLHLIVWGGGQDQVAAALQGLAAGKGGKGLASQDDRMAGGQFFEPLQVGADIDQLVAALSDGPVFIYGNNEIHKNSLYGHRNLLIQRMGLIALQLHAGGGKVIEIRHRGVKGKFGCLVGVKKISVTERKIITEDGETIPIDDIYSVDVEG